MKPEEMKVAKSVEDDLKPASVAKFDIPEKGSLINLAILMK